MIDRDREAHVQRLLAEGGHSQRAIARMTRVSRGVVADIQHARRPDYEALRRAREEAAEAPFAGPLVRCPTCGALVQMPCLACRLRSLLTGGRLRRVFYGADDPAGLGLGLFQEPAEPPRPGEADLELGGAPERYQEVREHRDRTGQAWQPPGGT